MTAVLNSLGADTAKYRRERSKSTRAVVSMIYSPPRVTAATKLLPELRIIAGFALDLTQLWDSDNKVTRERALQKVRDEKE